MAAVFLARQVLLAVSITGFLLCSCRIHDQKEPPHLESKVIYFPGTNDTMEITSFNHGKEHGRWVKYYTSHKIREERFFENGIKVDTLRVWWENGNLQASYPFMNGEYNGECVEWNESGVKIRKMHYKNGYEEGLQQQWYDNGSIRSNYIVINGRRFGLLGTKNCVNVSKSLEN
jgi:antitoxin component YwqK of YwqJK toxin-antitoxin module